MQHGFSAKQQKKKAKKKAKALKKKLAAQRPDGDIEMQEAPSSEGGMDEMIEQETGSGGRASHAAKVQIKRQLRVKVASLKQSRSKLTKLPLNKQARKQLTQNLKDALKEQQQLGKKTQTAEAGKVGDVMAD